MSSNRLNPINPNDLLVPILENKVFREFGDEEFIDQLRQDSENFELIKGFVDFSNESQQILREIFGENAERYEYVLKDGSFAMNEKGGMGERGENIFSYIIDKSYDNFEDFRVIIGVNGEKTGYIIASDRDGPTVGWLQAGLRMNRRSASSNRSSSSSDSSSDESFGSPTKAEKHRHRRHKGKEEKEKFTKQRNSNYDSSPSF